MKQEHCCEMMNYYLCMGSKPCVGAGSISCDDPDCIITYSAPVNEYGIPLHDGTMSIIGINFCPWCGKKLPASKREAWIAELEQLGYDTPFSSDIPDKYKTDEWWREHKE